MAPPPWLCCEGAATGEWWEWSMGWRESSTWRSGCVESIAVGTVFQNHSTS